MGAYVGSITSDTERGSSAAESKSTEATSWLAFMRVYWDTVA